LSYSFVSVPSSDGRSPGLKIARRDLFDARFQLISEGTVDGDPLLAPQTPGSDLCSAASALQFIDNPSDLVPLVYEGGLKTWECSLDLASCLRRNGLAANVAKGQRVLELGCGTAIPTVCLLQDIFAATPVNNNTETHVHLQDYNASVLQLVTVPNVVLAWYTSPAAAAYRDSEAHTSVENGDDANGADSELHITPELLTAFKTSLRAHGLCLRFFYGSWDTFDLGLTGGPYHLVLTSETVYHTESLPGLVRLLHDASHFSSSGFDPGSGSPSTDNGEGGRTHAYGCLVAAKTVYFGVGGGIAEFIRCVESVAGGEPEDKVDGDGGDLVGDASDDGGGPASDSGGRVETIWETSTGVSRRVMRVRWDARD